MEDFSGLWFDCESRRSGTSFEQCSCEKECAAFLRPFSSSTYAVEILTKLEEEELINIDRQIRLLRTAHAKYLVGALGQLSYGFVSLDASRPWIIYWTIHGLYLLDKEPTHLYPRIISTLKHIQNPTGGFGGGPMQISQGAPNYAAVLALCTIGTAEALDLIDRPAMYNFFMALKQNDSGGGFSIHREGEVDSRGTYTIVAIARLLNILTPELTAGVADYLLRCQTYEGGFGGEPGNEAHGGYNFCALAALLILGAQHRVDLPAQEHWLLSRQMKLEGGFQGRTNKLVDACYSFWQGAALAIVEIIRNGGSDIYDLEQYLAHLEAADSSSSSSGNNGPEAVDPESGDIDHCVDVSDVAARIKQVDDTSGCMAYNQLALQRYILHCAQNLEGGGLRDKPSKKRDYYHTCYALSGLSVSQRCMAAPAQPQSLDMDRDESTNNATAAIEAATGGAADARQLLQEGLLLPDIESSWTGAQVYGDSDNLLEPTSAVFNIGLKKLNAALKHFHNNSSSRQLPCTHAELTAAYSAAAAASSHR